MVALIPELIPGDELCFIALSWVRSKRKFQVPASVLTYSSHSNLGLYEHETPPLAEKVRDVYHLSDFPGFFPVEPEEPAMFRNLAGRTAKSIEKGGS
jgi:hypothetical protein